MLYGLTTTLEDKLVQFLLRGPATLKQFQEETGVTVSLRAIYKAANSLIGAKVLIKVGKKVWVNQQWVRSVREHLSPSLPPLSAGEHISYTFTSLQHLDVFWKTIAFQFEELEQDGQIFFYNPHNFWAYIPELKVSEDDYYAHFAKNKKHAFFTVGSTTTADKEFKLRYQNTFLQVDVRTIASLGRRDHITVLSDFVITARLSNSLARKIDEIYDSGVAIDALMPMILKAYRGNARVRLLLEHNPAKAKRLRDILSSNFYIPVA